MAIKKTGLGRGLDALFPEKAPEKKAPVKSTAKSAEVKKEKPSAAEEVKKTEMLVKISMVEPNRSQPRKQRNVAVAQRLLDA